MRFSRVTRINGGKSGEANGDPLICDTLAKVILIFHPATAVTDASVRIAHVKVCF